MKIRIEIEDKDLKSSHEFESQNMDGEVLRDKIIGFLSASGVFEGDERRTGPRPLDSRGTLMDKLESFIGFEFSNTWFTTQELREKYETVADDIKLSTVSTYLSRMNRDGLLERRGNRNNRQYRLIAEMDQDIVHHQSSYDKRKAEGRQ
jgi:hypothetical protein